ncbi:VWA domain-containing protein [Marinomonas communis]|uniref:Ca-activated chloride channel family protein n=1 Tax=Marinomonas communis TaxID=28254 RepID=A0A4R6XBT8_9GAMM|nr:VWA domain-containing protein [Marinomonas communis]TDR15579.1 Ca-activated chloride channel family protein [Marinomonas communis]
MTLFDVLHFNRPIWLLLIPIVCFGYLLFSLQPQSSLLKRKVAAHLLPFLTESIPSAKYINWLGLFAVSCFVIGISGISFSKTNSELYVAQNKTVFIVDQSLSMYATDVRPNRLTRSKQIIRDILQADIEGEIALIAFAGDAYTISPFTQDKQTLIHFLVALDPLIMPLYGSHLKSGIEQALELVSNDANKPRHFIILTDDLANEDEAALQEANKLGVQLDVIAVGTPEGGTMQLPEGQILKHNGITALAKTPITAIEQATEAANGRFYQHTIDDTDLQSLLDTQSTNSAKRSNLSGQTWQEQGHYFAIPLVLWLLWQFRQGWLCLMLLFIMSSPPSSYASPLEWFKTPDQKGQQAFDQGRWDEAAKLFEQPLWKAASQYANQDYPQTVETLQNVATTASDYYNLGNALALSNDLEGAKTAYETSLSLRSDFPEAKENLDYIKQQLKKTSPQEQSDNSSQQSNNEGQTQQSEQNGASKNADSETNNSQQKQDNSQQKQDNSPVTDTSNEEQNALLNERQIEQQQALDQWLRQIQDDPGDLIKRKLWYLHQERRHENRFNQEEGQQPW